MLILQQDCLLYQLVCEEWLFLLKTLFLIELVSIFKVFFNFELLPALGTGGERRMGVRDTSLSGLGLVCCRRLGAVSGNLHLDCLSLSCFSSAGWQSSSKVLKRTLLKLSREFYLSKSSDWVVCILIILMIFSLINSKGLLLICLELRLEMILYLLLMKSACCFRKSFKHRRLLRGGMSLSGKCLAQESLWEREGCSYDSIGMGKVMLLVFLQKLMDRLQKSWSPAGLWSWLEVEDVERIPYCCEGRVLNRLCLRISDKLLKFIMFMLTHISKIQPTAYQFSGGKSGKLKSSLGQATRGTFIILSSASTLYQPSLPPIQNKDFPMSLLVQASNSLGSITSAWKERQLVGLGGLSYFFCRLLENSVSQNSLSYRLN